jgi:Domain of Unknown Function (DUF1080)
MSTRTRGLAAGKTSGLMASAMVVACLSGVWASIAAGQQASAPPSRFVQPDPIDFNDNEGWTQIFDGKTLNGWDGPPEVWHVEDGAIIGESNDEHPSGTTNIIWRGGKVGNFMLKVEMKLEGTGANGGIQYRSTSVTPKPRDIPADRLAQMTEEQKQRLKLSEALAQKHAKWNLAGYQADFDYNNRYTGQLYEQDSPRGIIAWRGQMVATEPGKKPRLVSMVGNPDELKSYIKPGEWNQVEVIADGNTMMHIVNGHVMAILIDTDPKFYQAEGLLAFEIEGGGTVKISHRNVWLKKLP